MIAGLGVILLVSIDSEFADHYLYLGWDFSSFYAIIFNARHLSIQIPATGSTLAFQEWWFIFLCCNFFLLGQLLAIYSAAILPILVIVEAVIFFVILHLCRM